jgi:hypothetical protein
MRKFLIGVLIEIYRLFTQAALLIHMWSYLLSVKQRGPLDIGYNRLMAVVQGLYSTNVVGCTLDVLEMSHRLFIACSFFR